jgi:ABC-type branched-subunit amino acid transport system substrate-binding protein
MKNKKIISIVLVLVLILSFVLINQNNNPEDLTFGVISGMSGDYAVVGEGFLNGVLLAQEQWNTENPNDQIDIIVENDEFDSKKGLSAYKKLVEIDKVDALINMTTFTVDVIYDDAVERNIPVAQGFEQGIPAEDDNIVQLWPGNVPAEAKLGEHIRQEGFNNIAIVYDNSSSFFTQAVGGFKKGYELPVNEYKVSSDAVDLRSAAAKISQSDYDAVVLIVQPDQGSTLVKEIKKLSGDDIQLVFDANIQTGFETYKKLLGDTNILNGSIEKISLWNMNGNLVKNQV